MKPKWHPTNWTTLWAHLIMILETSNIPNHRVSRTDLILLARWNNRRLKTSRMNLAKKSCMSSAVIRSRILRRIKTTASVSRTQIDRKLALWRFSSRGMMLLRLLNVGLQLLIRTINKWNPKTHSQVISSLKWLRIRNWIQTWTKKTLNLKFNRRRGNQRLIQKLRMIIQPLVQRTKTSKNPRRTFGDKRVSMWLLSKTTRKSSTTSQFLRAT